MNKHTLTFIEDSPFLPNTPLPATVILSAPVTRQGQFKECLEVPTTTLGLFLIPRDFCLRFSSLMPTESWQRNKTFSSSAYTQGLLRSFFLTSLILSPLLYHVVLGLDWTLGSPGESSEQILTPGSFSQRLRCDLSGLRPRRQNYLKSFLGTCSVHVGL